MSQHRIGRLHNLRHLWTDPDTFAFVADGRVYFTAPKLFKTSLCLRGAQKDEGWFFVHVEFLITIGGDLTGLQGIYFTSLSYLIFFDVLSASDFPSTPGGIMRRHIADEADARLAFYLPLPQKPELPHPGFEIPQRPQLPEGAVDTPLVRVFNFLRECCMSCMTWEDVHRDTEMMSLSYQLEILWYQVGLFNCISILSFVDNPCRRSVCVLSDGQTILK